jgi:hypothetical protein
MGAVLLLTLMVYGRIGFSAVETQAVQADGGGLCADR